MVVFFSFLQRCNGLIGVWVDELIEVVNCEKLIGSPTALKSAVFLSIAKAQGSDNKKRTLEVVHVKDVNTQTSPLASPLAKRRTMVDVGVCTTPSLLVGFRGLPSSSPLLPPSSSSQLLFASSVVKKLSFSNAVATDPSAVDSVVTIPPEIATKLVRFVVIAKSRYDLSVGQRLSNFDCMEVATKQVYRFKLFNEIHDKYKHVQVNQVSLNFFVFYIFVFSDYVFDCILIHFLFSKYEGVRN